MDCGLIIEVLLVGLLPPAVPAVGEGERGEVPVEVETGVGLGLCWPAARAELPGTAAAAAYKAPPPGGGTGPGCGLRLLAASYGTMKFVHFCYEGQRNSENIPFVPFFQR